MNLFTFPAVCLQFYTIRTISHTLFGVAKQYPSLYKLYLPPFEFTITFIINYE